MSNAVNLVSIEHEDANEGLSPLMITTTALVEAAPTKSPNHRNPPPPLVDALAITSTSTMDAKSDTVNFDAIEHETAKDGLSPLANNADARASENNISADTPTPRKDEEVDAPPSAMEESFDSMFDSSPESTPTSTDSKAPSLDAHPTSAESSLSKLENENRNNTNPPLNDSESSLAKSSSEIQEEANKLEERKNRLQEEMAVHQKEMSVRQKELGIVNTKVDDCYREMERLLFESVGQSIEDASPKDTNMKKRVMKLPRGQDPPKKQKTKGEVIDLTGNNSD